MKIRTIIGVLLVLALVLGSTGVAFAAQGDGGGDCDGDGPIQDRLRDGSCNQECNRDCIITIPSF